MTFTINSKTLSETLTTLTRVIDSKNAIPVLDNIIFQLEGDTLTLIGANPENRMTMHLCILSGEGNGAFAVNAKTMLDAVKNISDMPLTFSVDWEKNSATIDYVSGLFSLPVVTTTEYPDETPIGEDSTMITIPAAILQENIARTLFATANDELRPVMNTICFDLTEEQLTIVASDGHHLVRNIIPAIKAAENKRVAFLLPKRPAKILKDCLSKTDEEVTIRTDTHQVEVKTPSFTLSARLIEGRYPNYNAVIPKTNTLTATVNRLTLMAALKRITPFSDTGSNLVKFHYEDETITVEASDWEFSKNAKESVTCDFIGEPITIGFKGSSIIEILDNMKVDEVRLEMTEPSRPALLMPTQQPEGQHILILQMPMLLSD